MRNELRGMAFILAGEEGGGGAICNFILPRVATSPVLSLLLPSADSAYNRRRGSMKKRNSGWWVRMAVLAMLCAPAHATVSIVSLRPSLASPQKIGAIIDW